MSPRQRRHATPVQESDDEHEHAESSARGTSSHHGENAARETSNPQTCGVSRASSTVISPGQRERDSQGRFVSGGTSNPDEDSPPTPKRATGGRATESQLLEKALQRGTFGDSIQALKQSSGPGLRIAGSRSLTPLQTLESRASGSTGPETATSTPTHSNDKNSAPRHVLTTSGQASPLFASHSAAFRPKASESGNDHQEAASSREGETVVESDIPSLQAIEAALRRHKNDLAEHHEYFTRNYLGRARRTYRRNGVGTDTERISSGPSGASNLPKHLIHEKSPFADMKHIGITSDASSAHDTEVAIISQTVEPVIKGPKMHKNQSTIRVPVNRYKASDFHVPFFTHCSNTAKNFRAENCSLLLYHPYFWDGSDSDPRMDELSKHLREGYDNLTEDRPKMVKLIHDILRWSPYADAFLEELEIEYKDVLRYLLQPDEDSSSDLNLDADGLSIWKDRKGSCQVDFDRDHPKWKRILTKLPPSSPRALAVAGLACNFFLRDAGFSLWHLARRAPFVDKLHHAEDSDEPQQPSDKVEDEACRICQLVSCPYHGITAESESSDSEDEDNGTASSSNQNNSQTEETASSDLEYHSSDEEGINIPMPCTAPKHHHIHQGNANDQEIHHNRFNVEDWVNKGVTNMIHKRKPFWPCDHEGSCEDAKCRCWREGITCEKSCGCSPQCKRRFRGCSCIQKGKPCLNRNKCECATLNRECDPDLCGTCGVVEVLDPVNRYSDEVLKHRCLNASIQRDRPKHTKLGISQIAGCGLYACEDIPAGSYISEYKGEICCQEEAERRGNIYDARPNNYLFTVGEGIYDLDSMRYGNKTRFINNSQNQGNINVEAKLLLCNTVVRIGMFASRNIHAGDELFFNYGYGNEITRGFWEIGEAPKPKAYREAVPPRKRRQKMKVVGQRTQPTNIRTSASEELSPHKGSRTQSKSKSQSRRRLDEIPQDDEDDIDYRPSSYLAHRAAAVAQGAEDTDTEGDGEEETPRRRHRMARAVELTPRGKLMTKEMWDEALKSAEGEANRRDAMQDDEEDDDDDDDDSEGAEDEEGEESDEYEGTDETEGAIETQEDMTEPSRGRKRKRASRN